MINRALDPYYLYNFKGTKIQGDTAGKNYTEALYNFDPECNNKT